MSAHTTNWVFEQSASRGIDRLVLLVIADSANDRGDQAQISMSQLAKKCAVDRSTVVRSLLNLEALGEIVRTPKGSPEGANSYRIEMHEKSPNSSSGSTADNGDQVQSAPTDTAKAQRTATTPDGQVRTAPTTCDVQVQSAPSNGVPRERAVKKDSKSKPRSKEDQSQSQSQTLCQREPISRLFSIADGASATGKQTRDDGTKPIHPRVEVFNAWVNATGRTTGRTKLDAKRQRLIDAALKSYSLDEVLSAVRGWQFSKWHCGQNPGGKIHNDLELLLRDAKHIEQFRDFAPTAPVSAYCEGAVTYSKWG